jgi:hypothetical protein
VAHPHLSYSVTASDPRPDFTWFLGWFNTSHQPDPAGFGPNRLTMFNPIHKFQSKPTHYVQSNPQVSGQISPFRRPKILAHVGAVHVQTPPPCLLHRPLDSSISSRTQSFIGACRRSLASISSFGLRIVIQPMRLPSSTAPSILQPLHRHHPKENRRRQPPITISNKPPVTISSSLLPKFTIPHTPH